MEKLYKIALCQMMVTSDKKQNLQRAAKAVEEAAQGGGRVVCLPEIWNSPYDVKLFGDYAEPADGPSTTLMSELAQKYGIYLIGGSIPEQASDGDSDGNHNSDSDGNHNSNGDGDGNGDSNIRMYNTSFVFDPTGALIAKHRKVHLFDVDIERGVRFKESDFFAPGENLTVFETCYGKMGLAVCFDLRFPDMFREMAKAGAHIVFLPASFNMTTGPAHWDTLIKSRALDSQFYLAACAPARNLGASYISWGHSCVASPWGELCAAADAREQIVYATIDIDYIKKIRQELPIGND